MKPVDEELQQEEKQDISPNRGISRPNSKAYGLAFLFL